MALSQSALQAVLAASTKKVFLECLRFEHSQINTLRIVNDQKNLERSDGVYSWFPFRLRAFDQTAERPPGLVISTTLVDQRLLTVVRQLAGVREKATITYEVVTRDAPDTTEFGPFKFEFDGASTPSLSELTIRASLLQGALNDAFPGKHFGPSNATATT